jgi:hypothetical protein
LSDLHSDFQEPIECPKRENYSMTIERSKALLTKMRGDLQDICKRYNQSGNGSNRASVDEDGNLPESFGHFDPNTLEVQERGDDRHCFLHNQPTDLLYWWHVLDQLQLLHFTTAKLRGTCAINSQGGKAALMSSEQSARKRRRIDLDETSSLHTLQENLVENFGLVGEGLKEMNKISRDAHNLNVSIHESSLQNEIEALREKKFNIECKLFESEISERLRPVLEKRIEELDREIGDKLFDLSASRIENIDAAGGAESRN